MTVSHIWSEMDLGIHQVYVFKIRVSGEDFNAFSDIFKISLDLFCHQFYIQIIILRWFLAVLPGAFGGYQPGIQLPAEWAFNQCIHITGQGFWPNFHPQF
jgi:hypothetical protein